jgi:hypothetical protein
MRTFLSTHSARLVGSDSLNAAAAKREAQRLTSINETGAHLFDEHLTAGAPGAPYQFQDTVRWAGQALVESLDAFISSEVS